MWMPGSTTRYPYSLIICSTSLLGPGRVGERSLTNPTIWPKPEEMSERNAWKLGFGWPQSFNSRWMRHPSLTGNCLEAGYVQSVLWQNMWCQLWTQCLNQDLKSLGTTLLTVPLDEQGALQFDQWRRPPDLAPAYFSGGYLVTLEVAMERCYSEFILDTAAQEKKKASPEKLGMKPSPALKPSGPKNLGCWETIKIHLKKMALGQGWAHVPPKDPGPDVGKQYETPRHQDDAGVIQAGCSPLTSKLLPQRRMYLISWTMRMMSNKKTQSLHKPSWTFLSPQMMLMLKWQRIIKPQILNLRLATPVKTSTWYGALMTQRWGQYPRSPHGRMVCWMKKPCKPKPPELADRGRMKTPDVLSPRRSEPSGPIPFQGVCERSMWTSVWVEDLPTHIEDWSRR